MADNFFGATDIGKMRSNNEDAFIAQEVANGSLIAACVIDGVGGYEGGEVAAAIARDSIIQLLDHPFSDAERVLTDALILANRRIIEEKSVQNNKMSCVLTAALADIPNNRFYYAHVGDTRLYLLRQDSLVKVTKDHSFIGFLEDSGRLTEDAAMRHPKRSEINKALGFDPDIHLHAEYFETGISPFLPGDTLLLCSDGLTDMVRGERITEILTSKSSLQHKVETLISAANDAGGRDNITVVLLQNDKPRQQHVATKPINERNSTPIAETQIEEQESAALSAPANKKRKWLFIGIGVAILVLIVLLFISARGNTKNTTFSPTHNRTVLQ